MPETADGRLGNLGGVRQGNIDATHGPDDVFRHFPFGQRDGTKPIRQAGEDLKALCQLGIAVCGQDQGPAPVEAGIGAVGAALDADMGPQVFVPQHGRQDKHGARIVVAMLAETAAGRHVLDLAGRGDGFIMARRRERHGRASCHGTFGQFVRIGQRRRAHRLSVVRFAAVRQDIAGLVEEPARQFAQLGEGLIQPFVQMIRQLLQESIVGIIVLLRHAGTGGKIGTEPRQRHRLAPFKEVVVPVGLELPDEFLQAGLVLKARVQGEGPEDAEQLGQVPRQALRLHHKGQGVLVGIPVLPHGNKIQVDAARVHVRILGQFRIRASVRIKLAQHIAQKAAVRQEGRIQSGHIEIPVQVGDLMGRQLLIQQGPAAGLLFFHTEAFRRLADVLAPQQRNRFEGLRRIRHSLTAMQFRAFPTVPFQLLRRQGCLPGRQGLCLCRLFPFFLARFRGQRQDGAVRIVQKVRFDQGFKIPRANSGPHIPQEGLVAHGLDGIDIIDPVVHQVETVDQAFRVSAKIRFAQLEFRRVQG